MTAAFGRDDQELGVEHFLRYENIAKTLPWMVGCYTVGMVLTMEGGSSARVVILDGWVRNRSTGLDMAFPMVIGEELARALMAKLPLIVDQWDNPGREGLGLGDLLAAEAAKLFEDPAPGGDL